MKKDDNLPHIWVVTENLRGTQNQCVGVAENLGFPYTIKTIGLKQPWKFLSPYLGFENSASFSGDPLTAPWPDIVIASGRKSIAACRYIARKSKGNTFICYIQDPRVSSSAFDLIALPKHDPSRGEKILVTTATPNRITDEKLAEGREEFPEFAELPSPRLAVLIGGASSAYNFSMETAQTLVENLKAVKKKTNGSLLITASRRTPPKIFSFLKEELSGENTYFWDETGDNPYFGFLGWGDYIFVTSDSASMLSEAATTGKPVYMIPLDAKSTKKNRLNQLQENLVEHGAVRNFEGLLENWSYTRLNDAQAVAEGIKKRLPERLSQSSNR